MGDFLIAPLIVFLVIVAPIWIIMHYRTKTRKQQGLSEPDQERLAELTRKARMMADRIESLEAILDEQTPEWRKQYERR